MPDEESLSDGTTVGLDVSTDESQDGGSTATPALSHQGYERLARMMADLPSNAVFRQFGFLNALNLLYYQAELSELEKELKDAAKLDRDSTDRYRQLYFQSHTLLSGGCNDNNVPNDESQAQWDLILRIRRITKAYNEAIIAQHTIRNIARPNRKLREWLRGWYLDNGDKSRIVLLGEDDGIWWKPACDLVALHGTEYEDAISTWITEKALFWYHDILGRRITKPILSEAYMATTSLYSRKLLMRAVSFLAIMIASLMPILSIVLLNSIQSMNVRLGLMALFTVAFCALFGVFTGPRKTELLAASAAFAAVQVVFITGNTPAKPS